MLIIIIGVISGIKRRMNYKDDTSLYDKKLTQDKFCLRIVFCMEHIIHIIWVDAIHIDIDQDNSDSIAK